jgi:16S rRNA (uracil1498-N3)-methyltransferase
MSDRKLIRLLLEHDLAAGANVMLAEAQAHYVIHVMRVEPGASVLVFNGRDGEWTATVQRVGKKGCTVALHNQTRAQIPEPDVWLAFAPLKRARIDMLVEKATELGAAALLPVFTQHTNAERINLERLRATAIEAAEQCERLTVPRIEPAVDFQQLLARWPTTRSLLVLDETGAGVPIAAALAQTASLPCGFLVGPEGGFTKSELDALTQLAFVTRVGLGPRILRAETAALAALVAWQSLVGDWRSSPQSPLAKSPLAP